MSFAFFFFVSTRVVLIGPISKNPSIDTIDVMVERTSYSSPSFPLSTSHYLFLMFGLIFLQRWADLGGSDATDYPRLGNPCPSLTQYTYICAPH